MLALGRPGSRVCDRIGTLIRRCLSLNVDPCRRRLNRVLQFETWPQPANFVQRNHVTCLRQANLAAAKTHDKPGAATIAVSEWVADAPCVCLPRSHGAGHSRRMDLAWGSGAFDAIPAGARRKALLRFLHAFPRRPDPSRPIDHDPGRTDRGRSHAAHSGYRLHSYVLGRFWAGPDCRNCSQAWAEGD